MRDKIRRTIRKPESEIKHTRKFHHEAWFMLQLRAGKKFSQAEIGEMIDMHGQCISNMECGKAGISLKQWKKLHDIFQFDWNDLACAMALDERDHCLKFMGMTPHLEVVKESREIKIDEPELTSTEFMEKVEDLYKATVGRSELTEDFFHSMR